MQTIDADKIRQELMADAEADAVNAVHFGLQRAASRLAGLRANLRGTTGLGEGLRILLGDVADLLADVRALELLRTARRNLR